MSPAEYIPEYQFPLSEWEFHIQHFLELEERPKTREEIMKHFRMHYPPPQDQWKAARVIAALQCLDLNGEAFEEFIVEGDGGALIAPPLITALWRYYSGAPNQFVVAPPPIDYILKMAAEQNEMRQERLRKEREEKGLGDSPPTG